MFICVSLNSIAIVSWVDVHMIEQANLVVLLFSFSSTAISCPFIENCVGKRNYPFFLGFTSFLSVDALMMSYVMYLYNAQVGFSVINTLAMIYYLAIGALLSVFSGFHWYLTAKNLTTNEVANLQRYPHFRNEFNRIVNPFDQGLIQNISSKLCLPSQAYAPVPST